MLSLRTSRGPVNWRIGDLATANDVFLYGYCSNFARLLFLRRPHLELCVVFDKQGSPDHYMCKDRDGCYLDISGRATESEVLARYEGEICDDIELDELEQNWDEEYDYLVESVMDEYLLEMKL